MTNDKFRQRIFLDKRFFAVFCFMGRRGCDILIERISDLLTASGMLFETECRYDECDRTKGNGFY